AADGEPLEGDNALALAPVVLGLDPGHQRQGDVLDVEAGVAALETDLPGEGAAGADGDRVEDRVDGGAADTERAEQSFEHHGGVHSLRIRVPREARSTRARAFYKRVEHRTAEGDERAGRGVWAGNGRKPSCPARGGRYGVIRAVRGRPRAAAGAGPPPSATTHRRRSRRRRAGRR